MFSEFYEILSFVQATQRTTRASVWEHFGMARYRQTDDAIDALLSAGSLRCRRAQSRHLDELSVTATGREQLDGEDKQRDEAAKREREKERTEAVRLKERQQDRADEERRYRTQNKIAIIMPLVTFALGVLVEHFYGIFGFFWSVLHG